MQTPQLRRPRLAPGDREDVEAVMNDRFQSPRALKRAKALLLLEDGTEPVAVRMRTGLLEKAQDDMLARFNSHGIHAAVFGAPRRPEKRQYDVNAIKKVLSQSLASRPPDGNVYWNLEQLAAVVQEHVEGAKSITRQSISNILRKEMGIRSIRTVEPYWLRTVKQLKAA